MRKKIKKHFRLKTICTLKLNNLYKISATLRILNEQMKLVVTLYDFPRYKIYFRLL